MDEVVWSHSGKIDYGTPWELYKDLDKEFNFTIDACASSHNTKHVKYWSVEDDSLQQDWSGHRLFCNPPYGEPENACTENCKKKRCIKRGYHLDRWQAGTPNFVKKAYEEHLNGVLSVLLVAARTDTRWFHKYVWDSVCHRPKAGTEVRFIKGRIQYIGGDHGAGFPSMLIIFRGLQQ